MDNYVKCPYCGEEILADATECNHCGKTISDVQLSAMAEAYQAASKVKDPPRKNGVGMTGFIFSLLSLGLSWLPGFNIILWVLAVVFSSVGISRRPLGIAVAGLIISSVTIVLIVLFSFLLVEMVSKYF